MVQVQDAYNNQPAPPSPASIPAQLEHVIAQIAGIGLAVEAIERMLAGELQRRERLLIAEGEALLEAARLADRRFVIADERLAGGGRSLLERDLLKEQAQQTEWTAVSAWERVRRFAAEHPEIQPAINGWLVEDGSAIAATEEGVE